MAKSVETIKAEIIYNSEAYLESLDKFIVQNDRAEKIYKNITDKPLLYTAITEQRTEYLDEIYPKLKEVGKQTILAIDSYRQSVVIPRFQQFKALKTEANALTSAESLTSEDLEDLNGIASVIFDFKENAELDALSVEVVVNKFQAMFNGAIQKERKEFGLEAGKKAIEKLNEYREEIDQWRKHPIDKALLEGFKTSPFAITGGMLLIGGVIFLLFFTKGGRQLMGIGGKVALKAM